MRPKRSRFTTATVCATSLFLAVVLPGMASAEEATHLGVASCAGNNCHGAVQPLKGSRVAQNEYLIWSQKDKHSKAFSALREERGRRIAENLGLPDAEHAETCLNCHADNVRAPQRGRQFQLADGVGCESCHGGASGWLGIHIAGADHQANVAAGLYPIEQPLARAERCLSCHWGDKDRFVSHQMMGAGHPPLGFELDTYTALQPAHYSVDSAYVARKRQPNDIQIWAVGQAVDLKKRMQSLLDPSNGPKGLQPELALFDCQSCHHATDQLQWRPSGSRGLLPGRLRLYDATAIMLQMITARVAPEAAERLKVQLPILHRATIENWSAVQRAAQVLRDTADELVPILLRHEFTRDDGVALARALIGEALDYSTAQQQTMALASITSAMHLLGFADTKQIAALNDGLGGLYEAVANAQAYRPEAFEQALRRFAASVSSIARDAPPVEGHADQR